MSRQPAAANRSALAQRGHRDRPVFGGPGHTRRQVRGIGGRCHRQALGRLHMRAQPHAQRGHALRHAPQVGLQARRVEQQRGGFQVGKGAPQRGGRGIHR
jgi:hypothetical protein